MPKKNITYKCCLCGKLFNDFGNNPWPLAKTDDFTSRCCDACNSKYVIPTRVYTLNTKLTDADIDKLINDIHTKEGFK